MPGKKVQCSYCRKVMRSDNLKNHIKIHEKNLMDDTDIESPESAEESLEHETFTFHTKRNLG